MKYKELAAFKTNEFKVGDMVRVYDYFPYEALIVEMFNDNGEGILKVQFEDPSSVKLRSTRGVHFKQCRKLEEVIPREFWINPDEKNCAAKILTSEPDGVYARGPFIKVIEVMEDE
jgi:hypothetical protein